MTEIHKTPNHERPLPIPAMVGMLGHLALHAYEHFPVIRNPSMPLFGVLEQKLANFPQPLHPGVPATIERVREVLNSHDIAAPEPLSFADKFTRSARMIQFTDRLTDHSQAFFEYNTMKALKDQFVTTAEQQASPLGFDQQLNIALELTGGNITNALTNLWLTSRQYARWLDNVSILNLPDMTADEIAAEMEEWRSVILACKNADANNFQDTAGDSYYAWTHARARVMYGGSNSVASHIGRFIFKHGTTINTHRFIKQSIPSSHKKAAEYGNRIGDTILDAINTK